MRFVTRKSGLALGLLALVLTAIAVSCGLARLADVPYTGTYKLTVLTGDGEITLCLVKIEAKDGKLVGTVIPVLDQYSEDGTIEDLRADAQALRFTLKTPRRTFRVAAYPVKGEKNLLGS